MSDEEVAAPAPEGAAEEPTPAPTEEGEAEPQVSAAASGGGTVVDDNAPTVSTPIPPDHGSPNKKKSRRHGKVELSDAKIGFIGAGKIAESIIHGLITHAKIEAKRIHVAAPTTKSLEKLKALGCHATKRSYDIFARYDCDIVFLCFHGNVIKKCFEGGSRPHPFTTNFIPNMKHPLYILSLISGITLSQIRQCLLNPEHPEKYMLEMHRIMINASCAYGLGLCAIDCDPDSKKLSSILRDLLLSISKIEYVPEGQIDATCALAGNGLAFAYYYIGALADGAFKMGLSRQTAVKFAAKTAQSAAQSLLESGKHPGELRDACTSPSGAAIYGIHVLDKADVQSGIAAAVEAAHKRANELSQSSG